ncbi:TPA: hypothetical protein DCZ36_03095, partial [Candidatus Gracilibacteria bacterium]|nr:hypothetical protein [Candidatus Gracilibacteria bacterium]
PELVPVSQAPEVKKIDLIGKSINDFNDYIKRNNYGNRIKQEDGVAKWVVADRKSEFSLVITKEGTVDYGMNVNTANFYYDNGILTEFQSSLLDILRRMVQKNKTMIKN